MNAENIIRGPTIVTTPIIKGFKTDSISTRPKSSVGQIKYTLTYVIKKGYFNLVRPLLALGADPNQFDAEDRQGLKKTALIYTTFIRDEKWAQSVARNLLEHGADLSQSDSRRLTPIHYCCAFGRSNLLNLFLNSLDFDLSRAVDLNGNTCLHYAIRSRNIKCIRMLLDKYGSSHMAAKVDIENAFGLKPSQIEDISDEIKTANRKGDSIMTPVNLVEDGGIEPILVCREELLNFIKKASQIKVKINKHLSIITSDDRNKTDETVKKPKKRSKSLKKDKIPKPIIRPRGISIAIMPINVEETVISKIETTSAIIEEQINELQSESSTRKNSKNLGKLGSNFNHIIKKRPSTTSLIKTEHKAEEFSINPVIMEKRPKTAIIDSNTTTTVSKPAPKPMDTQTARILTQKSFILDLKELIQNYIEYNGIFSGKEDMTLNVFANRPNNADNPGNVNRAKSAILSGKVEVDWKKSLPNIFYALECYMSPSYRTTVRPPVSTKVKYNNKDFIDFKAKLKHNSTRMGRRKTSISISHISHISSDPHAQFKILTEEPGDRHHSKRSSISESDVIVASLPFLRKNSCVSKKNSTDMNSHGGGGDVKSNNS